MIALGARAGSLEGLSYQLFTLAPKRFCGDWIQSVSAYAFADGTDGDIVRDDAANVAVFAVAASDLFGRGGDTRPHRGRGSLRNRLPLEGALALRLELLVDLVDHGGDLIVTDVTTQLGLYAARM